MPEQRSPTNLYKIFMVVVGIAIFCQEWTFQTLLIDFFYIISVFRYLFLYIFLFIVTLWLPSLRGLPFIFRDQRTKTNINHRKLLYCFPKYSRSSSIHFCTAIVFLKHLFRALDMGFFERLTNCLGSNANKFFW